MKILLLTKTQISKIINPGQRLSVSNFNAQETDTKYLHKYQLFSLSCWHLRSVLRQTDPCTIPHSTARRTMFTCCKQVTTMRLLRNGLLYAATKAIGWTLTDVRSSFHRRASESNVANRSVRSTVTWPRSRTTMTTTMEVVVGRWPSSTRVTSATDWSAESREERAVPIWRGVDRRQLVIVSSPTWTYISPGWCPKITSLYVVAFYQFKISCAG